MLNKSTLGELITRFSRFRGFSSLPPNPPPHAYRELVSHEIGRNDSRGPEMSWGHSVVLPGPSPLSRTLGEEAVHSLGPPPAHPASWGIPGRVVATPHGPKRLYFSSLHPLRIVGSFRDATAMVLERGSGWKGPSQGEGADRRGRQPHVRARDDRGPGAACDGRGDRTPQLLSGAGRQPERRVPRSRLGW